MSKSICALVHKPGTTREQFHAYYETSHAPLAITLFPFTGYVRNHVLAAEGEFAWDTISEFWSGDIEKAAALMNGPVGERMRADERRFMDQSRIAPASARELALSGGGPAGVDGARTAVLVSGEDSAALALARTLAAEHAGVSIDFISSWQYPAFPADAVIWIAGHDAQIPQISELGIVTLRVRRYATSQEDLLEARRAASSP
jgi:uncharacterized protein (TIGR02118 family)